MSRVIELLGVPNFPNIIYLSYPNQVMLARAFMRLQEFYESPIGNFRGRYFTRDEFQNAYMNWTGTGTEFTYFEDWTGFNVPGNVVDEYLKLFKDTHFTEETLVRFIKKKRPKRGKYYVIGTHQDEQDRSTMHHELSHAFWYLDPSYKKSAESLISSYLSNAFLDRAYKILKKMGYVESVFNDEVVAYLSTSSMVDLVDDFESDRLPWGDILKFQQHFANYLEEKMNV